MKCFVDLNTFKSLEEELKQAMIDYIEYHSNSIITVKEKAWEL